MKFDPEYIKLCDCEEIQELHKKFIEGDMFYPTDDKESAYVSIDETTSDTIYENQWRENLIWLPLEHQIDHKITYLCEKDHEYHYSLYFDSTSETWYLTIYDAFTDCVLFSEDAYDENILIAKISLLKKLLKESK